MLNEENSYFKSVVKDALNDLKHNGSAFVFCGEQVQAVKDEYKGELIVKEDDGFYKLTGVKVVKNKKRKNDN